MSTKSQPSPIATEDLNRILGGASRVKARRSNDSDQIQTMDTTIADTVKDWGRKR